MDIALIRLVCAALRKSRWPRLPRVGKFRQPQTLTHSDSRHSFWPFVLRHGYLQGTTIFLLSVTPPPVANKPAAHSFQLEPFRRRPSFVPYFALPHSLPRPWFSNLHTTREYAQHRRLTGGILVPLLRCVDTPTQTRPSGATGVPSCFVCCVLQTLRRPCTSPSQTCCPPSKSNIICCQPLHHPIPPEI